MIQFMRKRRSNVNKKIRGVLFGFCVGKSFRAFVEFKTRNNLKENKVETVGKFKTHCQPRKIWSENGLMLLTTKELLLI